MNPFQTFLQAKYLTKHNCTWPQIKDNTVQIMMWTYGYLVQTGEIQELNAI